MKSPIIDNIIFDVGKVLVDYSWETYLQTFGFDRETYEAIADAVFCSEVWPEHDSGILSDEEYLEKFIANAPQLREEICRVHERVGETITLYPYAEEWVGSLKNQGYHLYILSNYSHNCYVQSAHKMKFLPYMDGIVFSYQAKQCKPDPAIYETLLDRYHLDPARSLFLDDRPENIVAAKNKGIHGILFTNQKDAIRQMRETYQIDEK